MQKIILYLAIVYILDIGNVIDKTRSLDMELKAYTAMPKTEEAGTSSSIADVAHRKCPLLFNCKFKLRMLFTLRVKCR